MPICHRCGCETCICDRYSLPPVSIRRYCVLCEAVVDEPTDIDICVDCQKINNEQRREKR